jgi:hypothetical protein
LRSEYRVTLRGLDFNYLVRRISATVDAGMAAFRAVTYRDAVRTIFLQRPQTTNETRIARIEEKNSVVKRNRKGKSSRVM